MNPITPIIVAAPRQWREVNRLVEHCRKLDGTEVQIIEALDTGEEYPHRNNTAFHQAAALKKPFIWLEPDSIPLKTGWARTLTEEFYRQGKEMLVSSDQNPPYDLVGGIGVYGESTHWLVPKKMRFGGFDGWILRHISPLVGRTPLIQHSYSHYEKDGPSRRHTFPKDKGILRGNAVIFHADPSQSLIDRSPNGTSWLHPGDIGDAIAALPVIREQGGGHLIFRNHPEATTCRFYREIKGPKFESLKPLLESQDYILSVRYHDRDSADYDMTHFRVKYVPERTLTEAHEEYLGFPRSDMSPWLKVEPAAETKDRVIVARSSRYHTQGFPWKEYADKYGDRMLFIGHHEEHSDFQRLVGRTVELAVTPDFLRIARLIAGSELFIGNQSAPFWVAAGLGHPLIQERWNLDSTIPRDNALYISDK
jgi:hypothetical protein